MCEKHNIYGKCLYHEKKKVKYDSRIIRVAFFKNVTLFLIISMIISFFIFKYGNISSLIVILVIIISVMVIFILNDLRDMENIQPFLIYEKGIRFSSIDIPFIYFSDICRISKEKTIATFPSFEYLKLSSRIKLG